MRRERAGEGVPMRERGRGSAEKWHEALAYDARALLRSKEAERAQKYEQRDVICLAGAVS